jgi:hypothetical protein
MDSSNSHGIGVWFLFPSTHFDLENNEELMLALSIALLSKDLRGDVSHRQWLNWHRHVRWLKCQGLFWLYYRMSYEAFTRLLNLLQSYLAINSMKSRHWISNQDPIGPQLMPHCTLHVLADATYLDVMVHTGIYRSAIFTPVFTEVLMLFVFVMSFS